MDASTLANLPPEILFEIALFLPLEDQLSLLRTISRLASLLLSRNLAWRDPEDQTLLHLIAAGGFPESFFLMNLLCQLDVARLQLHLHHQDAWGQTPLMRAIEHENWPVFELLVEKDPSGINIQGELGDTALSLAVSSGRIEAVKLLLSRPSIQFETREKQAVPPLHRAVLLNRKDIVELLLDHPGIDVNCVDKRIGWTPLMAAVRHGRIRLVRMILSHRGVDVNAMDWRGYTALTYAIEGRRDRARNLLLARADLELDRPRGLGGRLLTLAITVYRRDTMELLLCRSDVHPDIYDDDDDSPLHYATDADLEQDYAEALLECGARVDLVDSEGRTAFERAIWVGNTAVVEVIKAVVRERVQCDLMLRQGGFF